MVGSGAHTRQVDDAQVGKKVLRRLLVCPQHKLLGLLEAVDVQDVCLVVKEAILWGQLQCQREARLQ